MPMLIPVNQKKLAIALSLQLLVVCSLSYSSFGTTFTITNKCPYTIWPGTLAGAGTPQLAYTGFQLDSGQSVRIPSVPGWSGRIWARTGCTFNAAGTGTCQTGDCGGKLQCSGMGATPPASLFEITLGAGDDLDYYDISLVDGYNIPVVVFPQGIHGNCTITGCAANINMGCPKELQVVGYGTDSVGEPGSNVIACKSACGAFGSDQYCCSGEFANPSTCKPSFYSGLFKRACPRAYSYAFDDGTSTFTCKGYDYTIVFCPANGMSSTYQGSGGASTAPPSVEVNQVPPPPSAEVNQVPPPPYVDVSQVPPPLYVDVSQVPPPSVDVNQVPPPFVAESLYPPFVEEIRHRKPKKAVSSSSTVSRWPLSMQLLILSVISLYL